MTDLQALSWQKIGNRYYAIDGATLRKSTKNNETGVYVECGNWPSADFATLDNSALDGNSQVQKAAIVSAFGL
jgi:hypothetical protein